MTSTERNLVGANVTVHADRTGSGYALTDATRAPAGSSIRGQFFGEFGEQLPITTKRLPFGADDTARGSIDAHLAVGESADHYRKVLGRNGIDGVGGDIIHVSGARMVNAYWDGTQIVIGSGDAEYKPLSADVDVVGHELTHGVIDHTAGFIYVSQGGALHEAYADYFGNAIDVGQRSSTMTAPRNGLLREDLCRTLRPVKCAIRNLDDNRSMQDYTGTLADGGGVHLNATIYGGALWDIRQALDPALSDKVVYRALSAYLTPWSSFTDGRDVTIAAARDLGLTTAQQAIVRKAFDSRGIVRGWEQAGRTDADRTLAADLLYFHDWFPPVAAGGRWALAAVEPTGEWPTSFRTGRTDGSGTETVAMPDGLGVLDLATDGRYVVASTFTFGTPGGIWLYDTVTHKGRWMIKTDKVSAIYPSVAGGRVAWQEIQALPSGGDKVSVVVQNIATGDRKVIEGDATTWALCRCPFPSLRP